MTLRSVMKNSTRLSLMATALVGVLLAATPASGAEAAAGAAPNELLKIDFEHQVADLAAGQFIDNVGKAPARITLVSANAPVTSIGTELNGSNYLRLPRYAGVKSGSYAALEVESRGDDWLSPAGADFEFGADVRLDIRSSGTTVDNGDNVMQRGLYADPVQYKLQVDNDHASCLVRGSKGEVFVKSDLDIKPKVWYQLRCQKSRDSVRLLVSTADDQGTTDVSTSKGVMGDVTIAPETPLAVGAKVSVDGDLVRSATDQFNGRLDNIVFVGTP